MTRDGTAEPVSRDQILRRERGQGNSGFHFPCSADHEQDWQPYPVDPYSYYMCDHTYILQGIIDTVLYNYLRSSGEGGGRGASNAMIDRGWGSIPNPP